MGVQSAPGATYLPEVARDQGWSRLEALASPEHQATNRLHREYTHIKAISMHAIHPETLLAAARHERADDEKARAPRHGIGIDSTLIG